MKTEYKNKFYELLQQATEEVGVVIIPIKQYNSLVNQEKILHLEKELEEQKQAFTELFEEKRAIVITSNPLGFNDMVITCYPKEDIPEIKEIKDTIETYRIENGKLVRQLEELKEQNEKLINIQVKKKKSKK